MEMFVNGNGICCRFMQQVFVRIDAFRYAQWRGWFTAKVTLESDECEGGCATTPNQDRDARGRK